MIRPKYHYYGLAIIDFGREMFSFTTDDQIHNPTSICLPGNDTNVKVKNINKLYKEFIYL